MAHPTPSLYSDNPYPYPSPLPPSTASSKPLSSLPAYTHLDPYHDNPSHDSPQTHTQPPQHPYTDADADADAHVDVEADEAFPLAPLLPYPAYHDAPPSYALAVRQAYRETLHLHISAHQRQHYLSYTSQHHNSTHVDADEEMSGGMAGDVAGSDWDAEDARYVVEKVVAMFVVVVALVVVTGVLGWLVLWR